jgi:hypothetical protein
MNTKQKKLVIEMIKTLYPSDHCVLEITHSHINVYSRLESRQLKIFNDIEICSLFAHSRLASCQIRVDHEGIPYLSIF